MLDLLDTEKHFLLPHIKHGGTVVDFTMGNGHDTLFLSRTIGKDGHVYAFDIQQDAVNSTSKLLKASNAPENYTLICDSHHNVKNYIKEPICAGIFNLGYLPGGDKSITTLRDTTLYAIDCAVDLLARDGGILIAVYPGHEEGDIEGGLIEEKLGSLDKSKLCCAKFRIINSPSSPFFFLIERG